MPVGPGKYDALCTDARVAADARACILIIIGGKLGSGFSVQTTDSSLAEPTALVSFLRVVANDIEGIKAGVI